MEVEIPINSLIQMFKLISKGYEIPALFLFKPLKNIVSVIRLASEIKTAESSTYKDSRLTERSDLKNKRRIITQIHEKV